MRLLNCGFATIIIVKIEETVEERGFVFLNGKNPTRDNPMGRDSINDLTFATPQIATSAITYVLNSLFVLIITPLK